MEPGLSVQYDGRKNYVLQQEVYTYSIGALACEYARLTPFALREIVLSCKYRKSKVTRHFIVQSLEEIRIACMERFGPVVSVLLVAELFDTIRKLTELSKTESERYFEDFNREVSKDSIRDYILSEEKCKLFSMDTVGDIFNYAYYVFSVNYLVFKASFLEVMKAIEAEHGADIEVDERILHTFFSMYGECFEWQKIDYKVMNIDGKFASVFTIQNSISLLLFEIAHLIESGTTINKCKNCGYFFVPENRSDTIYCSYRAPQNKEKTCQEIGAQVTRREKEKTDFFTREYRKAYMRLQMKIRRNPSRGDRRVMLEQMVKEAKVVRRRVKAGEMNQEEWENWLQKFC